MNEARNNSPRLPSPFFNRHTSANTWPPTITRRSNTTRIDDDDGEGSREYGWKRARVRWDCVRVCVRVSFQSKLIAVGTITLERPPDHSITTNISTSAWSIGHQCLAAWWKKTRSFDQVAQVCVYTYIYTFSRDPPFLSLSFLSRLSFASFSISSGPGWNRWRERHTIVIGGCATTYRLLFRGINSFHYDIPVINRECFVVRIFIGPRVAHVNGQFCNGIYYYMFLKSEAIYVLRLCFLLFCEMLIANQVGPLWIIINCFVKGEGEQQVLTATRKMLDWWNYFSFFRIFFFVSRG